MATRYSIGRNFEYRVAKYLSKHKWEVFRMAGSHTKADLIAFRRNCTPVFIQCKSSDKTPLSKKELKTLIHYKRDFGVRVLVVSKDSNSKFIFGTVSSGTLGTALIYIGEPEWIKNSI